MSKSTDAKPPQANDEPAWIFAEDVEAFLKEMGHRGWSCFYDGGNHHWYVKCTATVQRREQFWKFVSFEEAVAFLQERWNDE